MRTGALILLAVWATSVVTFLSGDIEICDWEDGCGPGFPEWLFYAAGWTGYLALAGLIAIALATALRRIRRR